MADRVRGVQVYRPVIYGSHARLLTEEERATATPGHTHRWTIFLTSAASPPPKEGELEDIDYLPGGADDLSYMIKRVTFKLHDTYTPSSRVLDKPPYKVTETGWGEFGINIRIQFVPEASEKPLNFVHGLRLHHWGPLIEGPLSVDSPAPPATSAAATPAPAPAAAATAPTATPAETSAAEAGPEKKQGEEKAGPAAAESAAAPASKPEEDETAKDAAISEKPDGETPAATTEVKTETELSTPAPTESGTAAQPEAEAEAATNELVAAQHPLSIAAKLPVHSWQYDELVFSDPPSAFLDILNEHPPTPLPAKFRRPRDQREKEEAAKKKKQKAGGRASTAGPASRAQTQEPGTAATPAPAAGIPGEAGSADVPLEFAKEMEIAEANRLADIKIQFIQEMDRLRSKLIADEKELSKLKKEMKV